MTFALVYFSMSDSETSVSSAAPTEKHVRFAGDEDALRDSESLLSTDTSQNDPIDVLGNSLFLKWVFTLAFVV